MIATSQLARFATTILMMCLIVGCDRATSTANPPPPRQRDRFAELKGVPAGDLAQPNPLPASWMLGCYKVNVSDVSKREWSPPVLVGLTDQRGNAELAKQHYRVNDPISGVSPDMWSWIPTTPDQLRLSVGTGFYGWQFDLQRHKNGLSGTARFWTDSAGGDAHAHTANLVRITCY